MANNGEVEEGSRCPGTFMHLLFSMLSSVEEVYPQGLKESHSSVIDSLL